MGGYTKYSRPIFSTFLLFIAYQLNSIRGLKFMIVQ